MRARVWCACERVPGLVCVALPVFQQPACAPKGLCAPPLQGKSLLGAGCLVGGLPLQGVRQPCDWDCHGAARQSQRQRECQEGGATEGHLKTAWRVGEALQKASSLEGVRGGVNSGGLRLTRSF